VSFPVGGDGTDTTAQQPAFNRWLRDPPPEVAPLLAIVDIISSFAAGLGHPAV
jgi:hypothetical protein